uniref:Clustered mitochondria protein homolog n=1 Tax=Kalanchoe fedtschenkoi TaxID=63787 RepID=A0A7N0UDV1_KALFE
MAGKSNKGRNKKAAQVAAASRELVLPTNAPLIADTVAEEAPSVESDSIVVAEGETVTSVEAKAAGRMTTESQPKQGDLHLYPVSVKTQGGEKLELQLNPGDSVMDVRQFLLDAPETCFITCYDLLLHKKDGSIHHLEDYSEISEVADITAGDCSLEMVPALYDDRSIRAHVQRTRDLLSLSSHHASLSTSLALEYETSKNAPPTSTGAAKNDASELDGLGFMDDIAGSLGKLLTVPPKEIKSIQSIVFSSFNPPPSYRRLAGDLIYLDIVSLEGNSYCITGNTKGFYVNSSIGNSLDPKPSKAHSEATTLVGLLQKISSKFKKAFREILERRASAHPFENVQSLLPPNSWLGLYPLPDHQRDAARAESAVTLSFGSELIGMQRDWNEELQSCREFPHATPQERILRDRALYKVTSDFVDAAISGAIGVISRCIPPINPTDPECFHMYVHNNIFFSFAVDADIEQLSKRPSADKKNIHPLNSVSEEGLTNGSGGVPRGDIYDNSKIKEPNGILDSTVNALPEVQLADSEQATYASANNDLRGTKAYQEADVSGLYNLAMAIIDYRGHRVVAQSVLPGILQGDKSDSLLYGSVDNGKKICWNEDFHAKVLEAAKRLHLKEHMVFDGSGNTFKLAAPVECKGIVGSDDRHYLLDLMRVTPRDANYTGPGSKFCILRPELVTAYCQKVSAAEKLKTGTNGEVQIQAPSEASQLSTVEGIENEAAVTANSSNVQVVGKQEETGVITECSAAQADISSSVDEITFNPNAFTEFKLAGAQEEIDGDEESVRKISVYLKDVVVPKFIQDLCTLEVSPMDGQTLTEALHAHGINLRYIGQVADKTKHLPHLWDLCSNEIVVRSAKHIFKDLLRDTEDHHLGSAISHFLNCFFGSSQAVTSKTSSGTHSKAQKKDQASNHSSKGQARWKAESTKKNQSSFVNISSDSLWLEISEFAKNKYQFDLPLDARSGVKKTSVIRNFCQKVGITIAARKYDLEAFTPFQTTDILDLQPVVKHSIPLCSEAKALVETGKVQLAEGMLSDAYTLFSEAFSILQQVTGPMHREVANCCRYLAMVLYHAGDMAGAIMQQHKELIINERCLGLDHPDTAHSYGNMALFYHGLNQTELALRHMSRALLLLSLSSGPDHPDVAATFINVAMMYQDIGKMSIALRYLQEALKKNERLLGEEHIQTAVCYHALAIAFNFMGAFRLSHQHEKRTYDILVKQLGEEDSRTLDSQNWLKTFKMREIQMTAQKQQKAQSLDAASAQKAIDILKARPDLIHTFQAAAAAGGSGSTAAVNKSLNAAILGETLPRGRNVDERAARAAAEVRKKAAARGLLAPPRGVPVQAVPPITQLFNIINSGLTPNTTETGTKSETDGSALQSGPISNGSPDVSHDQPEQVTRVDQAPAGLGKGLASLDNKKQKGKDRT